VTGQRTSQARAAVDAYQRTGDDAILVRAIRAATAAATHAAGPRIDLAVLLCTYGAARDDDASVREGLDLFASMADDQGLTPDERSRALVSWANALVTEHHLTAAAEPLEQAWALAARALEAASPGMERSDAQAALASVLLARHQDTGADDPLDGAIAALREAVALTEADDDPDRDSKVQKLAVALSMRSAARLTRADHEEAVTLLRGLLGRTPVGSPLRPDRLKAVAVALADGHDSYGLDALNEVADLLNRAHATATGRLRALIAADLAATLLARFRQGDGRAVLDRAVGLLTVEADQSGLSDVVRSALDARLGGMLTSRYIAFGAREDLDAALAALGRARERNVLRGHDRLQFLSDLGASLHELHTRSGLPGPLAESIEVLETARSEAGPSRALVVRGLLANLGTTYLGHHEVFGDRESLDSAIVCLDEAVADSPPSGSKAAWLASRGQAYQARFLAAGQPADLDEALASLRQATSSSAAQDAATRRSALASLAETLRLRAETLPAGSEGQLAAWRDATEAAEAALDGAASPDERALRLSNLGVLLMDRHDANPAPEIRRRALACLREAVTASRPDAPRYAVYLGNLASGCFTLGLEDGSPPTSPAALSRARTLLREATGATAAAALHRVWAAYTWARLACQDGELDEGIEAFAAAIALIGSLTGPRLNRRDRERHLADLSELARDAAACALQRGLPERAVEFLEQGRGVLIAEVVQGIRNAQLLRVHRPLLADALERIDAELAALDADEVPGAARRRRELATEQTAVIAAIRSSGVPGLAEFLRPPTLAELTGALPAGAVVVVNVSDYRSDAIILVQGAAVDSVPCPGLSPGALRSRLARFDAALAAVGAAADDDAAEAAWPTFEETFHDMASWLWDELAAPVLARLRIADAMGDPRDGPRIWWIPTGDLARFPLHAAGQHGRPGGASVFARVVSSYATTLTTLWQTVTSTVPEAGQEGEPFALAVAMPETPSLGSGGNLPSALAEVDVVRRLFPAARELVGPDATRAETIAAIRGAHIAHLACHAVTVPADPSRGRLLVHDGAVPIAELQALPIWRRGLAFLSACSTADVRGKIPDESVHLASAFQLIGFEHVIATIWPTPDEIALPVAAGFYASLWDPAGRGADPAAALHASVAAMLAEDPRNPFAWSYVHYGADRPAGAFRRRR
jgi:tetratricopeptide (TPR) repeat protein